MNPRLIGILVGVALIGGVVVYLLMSNASSTPAPSTSGSTAGSGRAVVVTTDPPAMPATGSGAMLPTTDVPRTGGSDMPTEYVVGDIRVRDHRGGNNKPLDVPPNPHPANARELPSSLTHDISQKVKQVFFTCGADVPKDARGPKPRLDGQLTTSIKDHQLGITGFVAQIRDVNTPYDDQVKACVEQKAAGMTTAAADQADITDYGIGVTFTLPN